MFSFTVLLLLSVILVLALLLKRFVIRRSQWSRIFPSIKYPFYEIYGDIRHLIKVEDKCFFILQTVSGMCQLFKDKPFFIYWASYIPLLIFKEPEDVDELIKGTKNLEKSWFYKLGMPWLKTGLLTSTDEKWRSRRKLVSPAFQDNVLKEFLPTINQKAMTLVKTLEKETTKERFDLLHIINITSLEILSETIMGVDIHAQEHKEDYIRASERALVNICERFVNVKCWLGVLLDLPVTGELKENLRILHNFTMSIIYGNKKRLASKTQDCDKNDERSKRKPLIDLLVEHQMETKTFTDADIQEELDIFTIAGHDSSSLSLTWTLMLLGIHPDIQQKVHQELDQIIGVDPSKQIYYDDLTRMNYLECVIKESLRLYPPVPLIGRQVEKDFEIHGRTIPKGTNFIISIFHVHRCERYFPNPEKFDPERFKPENAVNYHPHAWMPFAAGSRNCIGLRFALMKIKLVLSHVLRKYRVECLDQRDTVHPTYRILLHPTRSIQFRIFLRNSDNLMKND